jgi:hypothetical protein
MRIRAGEIARNARSGWNGVVMLDHEAALVAFVKLAGIAQSKRQWSQRDKFLLLAGLAAARAGLRDVASRCRELVLLHNSMHLIKNYTTLETALDDADFQPFVVFLQRFCSYERAEHYLTQLNISPGLPTRNGHLGAANYALLLLSKADLEAGAH